MSSPADRDRRNGPVLNPLTRLHRCLATESLRRLQTSSRESTSTISFHRLGSILPSSSSPCSERSGETPPGGIRHTSNGGRRYTQGLRGAGRHQTTQTDDEGDQLCQHEHLTTATTILSSGSSAALATWLGRSMPTASPFQPPSAPAGFAS